MKLGLLFINSNESQTVRFWMENRSMTNGHLRALVIFRHNEEKGSFLVLNFIHKTTLKSILWTWIVPFKYIFIYAKKMNKLNNIKTNETEFLFLLLWDIRWFRLDNLFIHLISLTFTLLLLIKYFLPWLWIFFSSK